MPRFALASITAFFVATCGAYQADDASTPTLWALPPAERVQQTLRLHNAGQARRVEFFIRDNARATTGVMVFLGDSITQAFPIDLAFNGLTDDDPATRTVAVNRGTSGERIEDLMERMDLCVAALQPHKLNILVGANDMWWISTDYHHGNLGLGIERLVLSAKALSPKTQIFLHTVTPLDYWDEPFGAHSFDECNPWVLRANEQIREVAKKHGCELVDLHTALSTPQGRMTRRYSTDGVHLSLLGYLRWIDEIVAPGPDKQRVWNNLAAKFCEETSATQTATTDTTDPALIYEAARANYMRSHVAGTANATAYKSVEQLRPEKQ